MRILTQDFCDLVTSLGKESLGQPLTRGQDFSLQLAFIWRDTPQGDQYWRGYWREDSVVDHSFVDSLLQLCHENGRMPECEKHLLKILKPEAEIIDKEYEDLYV